MSFDVEAVIERRRMKRRLSLWRAMAVIALVAAIWAIAGRNDKIAASLGVNQHVARISIEGVITDDRDMQALLDQLAEAEHVRAVIVRINSPGGGTAGGEALYQGLRRIAEKKPVAAVFGTAATSAAYMAGSACDYIVARGNSITGSVGVILQWADVTELLAKVGVKVETLKSGALKAVPSPFEPTDETARAAAQEVVAETQAWFLSIVTQRRKLSPEALDQVKTGRFFTGRQALSLGLIDAIGDEREARAWLEEKHGVSKSLAVVDWRPENASSFSLLRFGNDALETVAHALLSPLLTLFTQNGPLATQKLDGLVSVWQLQKAQ